jgi:hypothetical protein
MHAPTDRCSPLVVAALKLAPTTYIGRRARISATAPDVLRQTVKLRVADPRFTTPARRQPEPRRRVSAFAARFSRRAATFLRRTRS